MTMWSMNKPLSQSNCIDWSSTSCTSVWSTFQNRAGSTVSLSLWSKFGPKGLEVSGIEKLQEKELDSDLHWKMSDIIWQNVSSYFYKSQVSNLQSMESGVVEGLLKQFGSGMLCPGAGEKRWCRSTPTGSGNCSWSGLAQVKSATHIQSKGLLEKPHRPKYCQPLLKIIISGKSAQLMWNLYSGMSVTHPRQENARLDNTRFKGGVPFCLLLCTITDYMKNWLSVKKRKHK